MDRRRLGSEAEGTARKYLIEQGLKLLHQNFSCRSGELDIVGIQEGVLVIVEVRMRGKSRFGGAAVSVGHRKRVRIIHATQYLLARFANLRRYPIRFDVIALDGASPTDGNRIVWHRAAFDARI
jgi:putative endonuclease